MLPRRLTECSRCEIWAGGGGGEAFPYLLDFFFWIFGEETEVSEKSRVRMERRAKGEFLVSQHLCRLILNDWIVFLSSTGGFPSGSNGKESACDAGDLGSIPGLGRSPGEQNGYPLQYSGLQNSMDSIVHGVAKNWTRLSNFHFHSYIANKILHRLSHQGSPHFTEKQIPEI